MSLSPDQLGKILARVDRFWPQAPAFTPAELADWRRTLKRFPFNSVEESVDFWAGNKPNYRPDLTEILSKTQEIQRAKSLEAGQLQRYVAPSLDDCAPPDVPRASLAECRRELERARAS